jgi:CHASE2 domain-containing sensor protein
MGALILLTVSLLAFQTNHTWVPLTPALFQLGLAFVVGWLLPRTSAA